MTINILTARQIKKQIATQAKMRRLEKNLSRKTLDEKSGVPMSTIKRFETTGDISLDALLRIALVLDSLDDFSRLFETKAPTSLYELEIERQRGRE